VGVEIQVKRCSQWTYAESVFIVVNLLASVHQTIFSAEMVKQFKKLSENQAIKKLLVGMLNDLEQKGPHIGKLLDSRLHLFELKRGNPSLRVYYRPRLGTNKIDVFELEVKKSQKQQNSTIKRLRKRISKS